MLLEDPIFLYGLLDFLEGLHLLLCADEVLDFGLCGYALTHNFVCEPLRGLKIQFLNLSFGLALLWSVFEMLAALTYCELVMSFSVLADVVVVVFQVEHKPVECTKSLEASESVTLLVKK